MINKIRLSKYDKEWSKLVRARDQMCLVCGKKENLAAHHFVRRGVKSTRLMLECGVTLCPAHHVFNHEFSAHKTPEAFKSWFKSTFPAVAFEVEQKAKQIMKERDAIKEFQEKYLKELIKNNV